MIVCPNCNHQNPDGGVQCEACFTPLPAMTACPNCGASVQTDASFCGQCGFNLKPIAAGSEINGRSASAVEVAIAPSASPDVEVAAGAIAMNAPEAVSASASASAPAAEPVPLAIPVTSGSPAEGRTQLQQHIARLLHTQTNTSIEIPPNLTIIHLGKPNDRIPPDIDVSGFPNSEIVSRIHADIRLEGDAYYIEDVGSSNGTYINNMPLPIGNRHRLRPGDRIALGKGDKVTFLFQLS